MRQVLGPGALGRPRGIRWRGRWEGGSGWGIHVNPWLIHVNVWQKPLQYCKVISLQIIKINGKKIFLRKKKKLREKKKETKRMDCESESCSVMSNSLQPQGLHNPWNSPGQNTGASSISLLQGIFPTQGLNPGLPHCGQMLYQLSHKGSPSGLRTHGHRLVVPVTPASLGLQPFPKGPSQVLGSS